MNGFFAAALASTRAFVSRERNAATDPTIASWSHATIAVAVLLVVVVATEILPAAIVVPQLLPELAGPMAISLVVHAVPFVVIVAGAIWSKQSERLPLVIMLLCIAMVLIQVTLFALSVANVRAEAAVVGVIAYMAGRASRTMLNFSIAGAVVTGLIVGVGTLAASQLFALAGP